jgi:hypothetical protein
MIKVGTVIVRGFYSFLWYADALDCTVFSLIKQQLLSYIIYTMYA